MIEIEYVTLLDQRGKEIRFSLPTTISPRYLPAGERIHPEYTVSVPYGLSVEIAVRDPSGVESVESASHPVSVSMGNGETTGEPATVVRFASDAVAMDRDFVLAITRRGVAQGRAWRFSHGKSTWIQLDLAPEEAENARGERGRREVIFVLDCSGSMQGDSIERAKRALGVCLKAMKGRRSALGLPPAAAERRGLETEGHLPRTGVQPLLEPHELGLRTVPALVTVGWH